MIDLKVTALVRSTYAALPGFLKRVGGAIINIASVFGIVPELLNGVYGGTKAFVIAFSRSLHKEFVEKNIMIALTHSAAVGVFQAVGAASFADFRTVDWHAVCATCGLHSFWRDLHHPLPCSI